MGRARWRRRKTVLLLLAALVAFAPSFSFILLGAARYLAETRNFAGDAVVIFQPAEEGGAGAAAMIKDGLMDRFAIDQVYGMHNGPGLPVGSFAIRQGPIMAATDAIDIKIEGLGGHAARLEFRIKGQSGHAALPHLARDPVIAAAHLVIALQSIVSRTVDPLDSAVISMCEFHAGHARNVIPQTAELKGTVRTLTEEVRTLVEKRVREVVAGQSEKSAVVTPARLTSRQQQLLASLREAPVLAAAQKLWYQTKALELAAELFFLAPGERELFCQRQQRLSAERVEKVIALLRKNPETPPNLEEIGRAVGCSPFHLSRTFSAATGMTIPQYIRQLRMERAAELLRSGKFNVTEAALEVGYSSLSHFSQAFHETFGCCPGLYPLRTPTQKTSLK